METTTTENYVRIVFLDSANNEFVVPLYHPKENITLAEIQTAFQVVMDTDMWYSPSSYKIVAVKKADIVHLEITEEILT